MGAAAAATPQACCGAARRGVARRKRAGSGLRCKNQASRFRGVTWDKYTSRWMSSCHAKACPSDVRATKTTLRRCDTEEEAAECVRAAAFILGGR